MSILFRTDKFQYVEIVVIRKAGILLAIMEFQ